MKSNGLLKWLMIPMVLLLLLVLVKLLPNNSVSPSGPVDNENQLTVEEMKALGLEGDTPSDTVATLVAQVRQLRGELKKSLNETDQRGAGSEQLRQFEDTLEQRIQLALEKERQRMQEERVASSHDDLNAQGLLQDLQRQLDSLNQKDNSLDLPVGLGLQEDDRQGFHGGMRWIEPDDA